MFGVRANELTCLTALLDAKANLDVRNENGMTALMIAIQENRSLLVSALLQKGNAALNIWDDSALSRPHDSISPNLKVWKDIRSNTISQYALDAARDREMVTRLVSLKKDQIIKLDHLAMNSCKTTSSNPDKRNLLKIKEQVDDEKNKLKDEIEILREELKTTAHDITALENRFQKDMNDCPHTAEYMLAKINRNYYLMSLIAKFEFVQENDESAQKMDKRKGWGRILKVMQKGFGSIFKSKSHKVKEGIDILKWC